MNSLNWADQHIHHVDGFGNTWFFGSDMARFRLVDSKDDGNAAIIPSAWCVAVDLEDKWVDIMLLWIVPGELEPVIERALRQAQAKTGVITSNAYQRAVYSALERSVGPKLGSQKAAQFARLSQALGLEQAS